MFGAGAMTCNSATPRGVKRSGRIAEAREPKGDGFSGCCSGDRIRRQPQTSGWAPVHMETGLAARPTDMAPAPARIELLGRKPPTAETGGAVIPVLLVSPFLDDQVALRQFLRPPKWSIYSALTLKSAIAVMELERLPLVLCERDLGQDTWKDVLAQATLMLHSPLIIVTSRLADEHLWAEALNLGAYDVLAQPFDATEVIRILSLAWVHWCIDYDAAQWPQRFSAAGA